MKNSRNNNIILCFSIWFYVGIWFQLIQWFDQNIFFILLKRSIGLAGMAPFYGGVAPLQDPNKYLDGTAYTTCYGARLGCKFHSI